MYVNEFQKLGLSKGEAEVYASLLQFGELSASEIAKKTNIGRTNVYEYANNLMKRGLVAQFEKGSKIVFRAEDPLMLSDLVDNKQREARELALSFSTLIPKLETLYNRNINKPLIKFYQGEQGYKELMEKIYFENDDKEMFYFIPDLDDYQPPEPKYRNTLLRKQVFTNLIANKGESVTEFNKRDKRELRRTTLLSPKTLSINLDLILFEDIIIFGTLAKENFAATLIKNSSLIKLFKSFAQLALTSGPLL